MIQYRQWERWFPLLILGLILLGAAYLRFRGQIYTEMTGDQGILYSIALTWVTEGQLPLAANKASAGIMNPPLIEYLIALPMMIRPTLLAAAQFQALLSLASLVALYAYSAYVFNYRVALLAVFLFAFNPWAVHYSRFVWNPNPVPFFSTLMLGSMLVVLTKRRAHPLHLTLAVVALAAITQLHLSSLVLIPIVVTIALLFRRRLWRGSWWATLWPLLLGLALALVLYLPYIVFESSSGWGDVGAVFSALLGDQQTVSGEVPPATFNAASWLLVYELTSGANLHEAYAAWREAVLPLDGLFYVAGLLLVVGLVYGITCMLRPWLRPDEKQAAAGRTDRTVVYAVLAIWILVPVIAYLRHTIYLQNYYFLYILPAPFLLMALVLENALTGARSRLSGAARTIVVALLLAPVLMLGLWQFHINHVGLALAESGDTTPERTLGRVQEVIETSDVLLQRYPECDLTIVAEEMLFERSTFALVKSFVQPRRVRLLEAGHGYIVPQSCALYLVVSPDPMVEEWLAEIGEPLPERIIWEGDSWQYYLVPTASRPPEPAVAQWQNGLELLAVDTVTEATTDTLPLTYHWHVTQEPPDVFYHFFNHILNEQGGLVAQQDAMAIDTRNWHEGDRLVTTFEVALPELAPGRYTVNVGLYTWPDIIRIPRDNGDTTYQVLTFER